MKMTYTVFMYKDAYHFQAFYEPITDGTYAVLSYADANTYFSSKYKTSECSMMRLKRIEKILAGRHDMLKKSQKVFRRDGARFGPVQSLVEFRAQIQSRLAARAIEEMMSERELKTAQY